jgi:hypothetical protein
MSFLPLLPLITNQQVMEIQGLWKNSNCDNHCISITCLIIRYGKLFHGVAHEQRRQNYAFGSLMWKRSNPS